MAACCIQKKQQKKVLQHSKKTLSLVRLAIQVKYQKEEKCKARLCREGQNLTFGAENVGLYNTQATRKP